MSLLSISRVDADLGSWNPTHYCKLISTGQDRYIDTPIYGLVGIGVFSYDSVSNALYHKIIHNINGQLSLLYTDAWPGVHDVGSYSINVNQGLGPPIPNFPTPLKTPIIGTTFIGDKEQARKSLNQGTLALFLYNGNTVSARCNIVGMNQQEVYLYSRSDYINVTIVSLAANSQAQLNYDSVPEWVSSSSPSSSSVYQNLSGSSSSSSSNGIPAALVTFHQETSMVEFHINQVQSLTQALAIQLVCGSDVCWQSNTTDAIIQGVAYCPMFPRGDCSFRAYYNNSTEQVSADHNNTQKYLMWFGELRDSIVLTAIFTYTEFNTTQFGVALVSLNSYESITPYTFDIHVILPGQPNYISVAMGSLGQVSQVPLLAGDITSFPFDEHNNWYTQRFRIEFTSDYQSLFDNGLNWFQDLVVTITTNSRQLIGVFEPINLYNIDSYYTHTCYLYSSVGYQSNSPYTSPFAGSAILSYDDSNSILSFVLIHTLQSPGHAGIYVGYPGEDGIFVIDITDSTSPVVGSVILTPELKNELELNHLYILLSGDQNGARCQIVGKNSQEVTLNFELPPFTDSILTYSPAPTNEPTSKQASGSGGGGGGGGGGGSGPRRLVHLFAAAADAPTTNPYSTTPPTSVYPTSPTPTPYTTSPSTTPPSTMTLYTTTPYTTTTSYTTTPSTTAPYTTTPSTTAPYTTTPSTTAPYTTTPSTTAPYTTTPYVTTTPYTTTPYATTTPYTTPPYNTPSTAPLCICPTTAPPVYTPPPTCVQPTSPPPTSYSPPTTPPPPTTTQVYTSPPTTQATTQPPTPPYTQPPTIVYTTQPPTTAYTTPPPTSPCVCPTPTAPYYPPKMKPSYSGCLLNLNPSTARLQYICNFIDNLASCLSFLDANNNYVFNVPIVNNHCNGTLKLTYSQMSEYISNRWSLFYNNKVTQADRLVYYAAVQTTIDSYVILNYTSPPSYSQRLTVLTSSSSSYAASDDFQRSLWKIPIRLVYSLTVTLVFERTSQIIDIIDFSTVTNPVLAHIHAPGYPGTDCPPYIMFNLPPNELSKNTWTGIVHDYLEDNSILTYIETELAFGRVHSQKWPYEETQGTLMPIQYSKCPTGARNFWITL